MNSFIEKAVLEFAPIGTAQCVIRCMLHSGRQWFNVVPKQKLNKQTNKQTNKQIKQTNKTVSMSSSMVVWWVRSHIVLELAPILPLILLSVCMVSSLPYCMQRSNTEAYIHETCNVRTQMHADRNNAKCEHRAYIHVTWNVRAQMHADRNSAIKVRAPWCDVRFWIDRQLTFTYVCFRIASENPPKANWTNKEIKCD